MRLFWIDLYANWFSQNQHMGGTHSRTYDFLKDTGSTDRYYYASGLLTARAEKYWRGLDVASYTYLLPADVPGLFTTYPMTILRDFNRNTAVEEFSTNYVGSNPNFSVGSMTTRGYDDVTAEAMTITMPGDSNTANVNFNTEGRFDPYLKNAIAGSHDRHKSEYPQAVRRRRAACRRGFVPCLVGWDESQRKFRFHNGLRRIHADLP